MIMKDKKSISSEILFVLAMIINSFMLVLMVKSNLGISTLSSVPLVLYKILPNFTLGTWTIIMQVSYIIVLILFTRKFKYGYLISFIVSVPFGLLVDLFTKMTLNWPLNFFFQLMYFGMGLIGMAFGAALFVLCKLPILPFDLVVREVAEFQNISVKKAKMFIDIISVFMSVSLSLLYLKRIEGVGLGTILSVFLMGRIMQIYINYINKNYILNPKTKVGKLLTSIS